MKNSIAEIKNTLGEMNKRINDTEKHINTLEDRIMVMVITQSEQQKEKQIKNMKIV